MSKIAKHISTIAILYFMSGLLFATSYAFFYHWGFLSFLSPGFYVVVLTWPVQLPGFILDLQYYGLAGKTLTQ